MGLHFQLVEVMEQDEACIHWTRRHRTVVYLSHQLPMFDMRFAVGMTILRVAMVLLVLVKWMRRLVEDGNARIVRMLQLLEPRDEKKKRLAE